jgi:hypothetical protein
LNKATPFILIFILLIFTARQGATQTLRLNIKDVPLSRALDMLGVDISFDERAVSEWNVTVDRSFSGAEEAIMWLLDNKPFEIEKIGRVYVIVPAARNTDADTTAVRPPLIHYIYTGTVVDNSTGDPIEYAVVGIEGKDGQAAFNTVTSAKGRFLIRSDRQADAVRISHLGYETITIERSEGIPSGLGIIRMAEHTFFLDETIVTADDRQPTLNRIRYTITSQMCNNVDNALELLDNIPGVFVDKSTESIRMNNRDNILLLVDGAQRPTAWLKHLSPQRVHAVEVVNAASGRFVSDDYAAILRLILKDDYTGYDIHASHAAAFNLSDVYKTTRRMEENHPALGISYAARRWGMFASYEYNGERRNIPFSKYIRQNYTEMYASLPSVPNNLNEQKEQAFDMGMNYHISQRHSISMQADLLRNRMSTLRTYALRNPASTDIIFTNTTENVTTAQSIATSVFYQGQAAGFRISGDFSYNYYYNDVENEYSASKMSNYRYSDLYNEYKNQIAMNVEVRRPLSKSLSLEAGYSTISRNYASSSSAGTGFLNYIEGRNRAYTYFSYLPDDKTAVKAGLALEHIDARNRDAADRYTRILPYFQLNRTVSKSVAIQAGYAVTQSYPALYQLSPMSMVIDTFLTQIGNPALRSSRVQRIYTKISLHNKLEITPRITIIDDEISEMYNRIGYKLYRTFNNIHKQEYSLITSFEKTSGNLRLRASLDIYREKAHLSERQHSLNGILFQADANYRHIPTGIDIQAGYYRNMRKNVLLQGHYMSDRDYILLSLHKNIWRDRISIRLSYLPQLSSIIRSTQEKEINSEDYAERTVYDLRSDNHRILLRISIRLERGSISTPERRKVNTPEREK